MTIKEAITELMQLTKSQFNKFYNSLPARTHLLIDAGLVDFQETLAKWWIHKKE